MKTKELESLFAFPITLHPAGTTNIISINYYNNNIYMDDFINKIVPKYKISKTNKFKISTFLNLEESDDKYFFIEQIRIINTVDTGTIYKQNK